MARAIANAPADQVVPLASVPGSAVALDDFLRTRIVEVVVHTDDIATSVNLDAPQFSPVVWEIATGVLLDVALIRRSPLDIVRWFARPDRTPTGMSGVI